MAKTKFSFIQYVNQIFPFPENYFYRQEMRRRGVRRKSEVSSLMEVVKTERRQKKKLKL